jgi:hypothetical protein
MPTLGNADTSDFRDRHGAVLASLTRHTANAVIGTAGIHGIFFAIFLDQGNSLDRAILNAIAAGLAFVDVDRYDEHKILQSFSSSSGVVRERHAVGTLFCTVECASAFTQHPLSAEFLKTQY